MNQQLDYAYYKELADKYILELSNKLSSPSKDLVEAMKYSLLSDGKRLRPVIFLAAFDACKQKNFNNNNDEDVKKNFCFAIEALHTYTLIHDDLPCMDNDSVRRGKPSNHIVFGQAHALLAGDGLLNSSIEHALAAVFEKNHIEAVRYFFNQTGIAGVIGGQSVEFELCKNDNEIASIERDLQIMECKTAALFRASAVAGGICGGGAESKTIDLLKQFGFNFGMAFQIRDDIKDCDNAGFMQKYGPERADIFLREYTLQAISAAKELNSSLLASLCDSLCD